MTHVTIVEMSPRDGLQNEKRTVPTADKIRLVDMASACGFERIEAASFVSPRWVPQMADAAEVLAGIDRRPGTRYAALTPNRQGLEAAIEAGADEVAIFGSASEAFSKANINCSIAESLERFGPVVERARQVGLPVRGYISCVVACPYSGPVEPASVADLAGKLLALGCYEVSLGDTIGAGTPDTVGAMLDAVLPLVPARLLAGHYHDTNGARSTISRRALPVGCASSTPPSAALEAVPTHRARKAMSIRSRFATGSTLWAIVRGWTPRGWPRPQPSPARSDRRPDL